ncbi:T9SS type A sorting domain-containing protein [Flammeovirga sp. SR4]|uniref:T9SS type A sorting domain-containing protein n=2 Tax=Flammeovirga agarivorans TaxID=2726742 RepID=A0A7X8XY33_9BACT|nr:T9SS type A sorting domain-containing protein [Flammeovirga agarivorans]
MKRMYLRIITTLLFLTQAAFGNTSDGNVIEAEGTNLTGDTSISSKTYASGGSFVKLKNTEGNKGTINIPLNSIPEAGTYKLHIYGFNGGVSQSLSLSVNGGTSSVITIQPSNWAFEDSAKVTLIDVDLLGGDNTISLAPHDADILLDKFEVTEHYNVFYFSADGDDNLNDGSINSPWQTLAKASAIAEKQSSGGLLSGGDKMLFRAGDTFEGEFLFKCSGEEGNPIEVSSYGTGEYPIISGSGNIAGGDYFEAMRLINVSHVVMSKLWFKNDRQSNARYTYGESNSYGVRVVANKWGGVSSDLVFRDLKFSDIFGVGVPEEFNDYSVTGLRFESEQNEPNLEVTIKNVLIEDCYFTHLGKAGVWAIHKGSDDPNNDVTNRNSDFIIRNNTFFKTGGSGVILSKMLNALVENNDFDHSGHSQSSEGRLAGRGSGMWVFKCVNVLAQYNASYSVRGPNDSYGMHIDFGNKNIIFQYNYSEDSEGGFVEVLGDNHNVAYRYNVSVNDGIRDFHGSTIWTSGYVGTGNTPVPSNDVYVYNNTIYLDANQKPDFSIFSEDTYIYNNIFVQTGSGIIGEKVEIDIQNGGELIVDNNLFVGNINSAFKNLDNSSLTQDPNFVNPGAKNIEGYKINSGSPVIDSGKIFPEPTFPMAGQGIFKDISLVATQDIYGNEVDIATFYPNVGADNNYNTKIDPTVIRVDGVTVSPQSTQLVVGDTQQLSAGITPANANNKNVTWSSSDTNIATVDQNGLVTAVGDGSVSITVTTEDKGLTAVATIHVGLDVITEVLNNGFENGLTNWEFWADASTSTDAYHGNSAAKLTGPSSIRQWVKVKPNTTYTLSAFARVLDPENDRVVLGVNDEKNKGIDNAQIYDTEYTLHHFMFTTKATTDSVKVFFWRPGNGVGNAFVDEITLQETAYAINSNFDKGLLGWNPWGSGTVSNSASSMKVVGYGGANQYIKTKSNTTYEVSFSAKLDDASVKANFVTGESGGGNYTTKDIFATEWTDYTITFTTSAESEDTKLGFWRPNGSTGGAYLDNIVITEVGSNARSINQEVALEEELSVMMYPNPAKGVVNISTNVVNGDATVNVFSLLGQPLLQKTFQNQTKLSVTDLKAGLYLIVVTDALGHKSSEKLYIK